MAVITIHPCRSPINDVPKGRALSAMVPVTVSYYYNNNYIIFIIIVVDVGCCLGST